MKVNSIQINGGYEKKNTEDQSGKHAIKILLF